MTRTLVVSCDAIPTLDPDQMRRLSLAVLLEEDGLDPDVRTFVHGPEGIGRYIAALQRVSADIADQRAAFNAGRFTPRGDAEAWTVKSGRLKERIDRALPDLRALQAEFNRQANSGDVGRRLRQLVAAVELHRTQRQANAMTTAQRGKLPGTDALTVEDGILWAELDRITGKTPTAAAAG